MQIVLETSTIVSAVVGRKDHLVMLLEVAGTRLADLSEARLPLSFVAILSSMIKDEQLSSSESVFTEFVQIETSRALAHVAETDPAPFSPD